MNRAERRRLGKENHETVINVKISDFQQMKLDATKEASDKAFFLMLAIPVMVFHDKYGQLMKKIVNGKSREERFTDFCLDLYDSFEKDYVSLDDLRKCSCTVRKQATENKR